MATPTTVIPPSVKLTPSAVRKIRQLIEEEGNLTLMLRVFITGGGCSGFQYGFAFEAVTNPDDTVITQAVADEESDDDDGGDGGQQGKGGANQPQRLREVKLVIDAASYPYLVSATIDYKVDVQGEQFIIDNPNATTTCGCGSSFSV